MLDTEEGKKNKSKADNVDSAVQSVRKQQVSSNKDINIKVSMSSRWWWELLDTDNYHSFEKEDDDDWEAWETGVRDETDHFIQFHFA